MRYYPEDENDLKDLEALRVEQWMTEQLKLNPDYLGWGPHEDYMIVRGESWNSPQTFETWSEFGPWGLDDLNECANFYFQLQRDAKECEACGGEGYNPETKRISDDFYDFAKTGRRWAGRITQDEFDALKSAGRLFQYRAGATLEEVNAANSPGGPMIGTHDAINRWILIETRARRLGVWGRCEACGGDGSVFVEERGRLALILWWMHPRKGCSRGLEIRRIERAELPAVFSFLHAAAERNTARFGKIPRDHTTSGGSDE